MSSSRPAARPTSVGLNPVPSVLLVVALGGLALLLAPYVPMVNEVVIALIGGLLIANVGGEKLAPAKTISSFMLKRALKLAVILLGAGVNLALIRSVGLPALSVILVGVLTALSVSFIVGRKLELGNRPAMLVGVGTAICGASAIAALAPVIKAKQEEIGVALAAVLGFNAVALLLFPVIGAVTGMDPVVFGTWAGVAVHDAASAIATGFALGPESGEVATLVKLARILFLIPLLGVVAGTAAVRDATTEGGFRSAGRSIWNSLPWFVFGFAALTVANSLGWLGGMGDVLSDVAKLIIVFVVGTIGLTLRLSQVVHLGRRVFITGFAASISIAVISLAMIYALDITAA